jgi:hypothetical protein
MALVKTPMTSNEYNSLDEAVYLCIYYNCDVYILDSTVLPYSGYYLVLSVYSVAFDHFVIHRDIIIQTLQSFVAFIIHMIIYML